MRKIIINGLLIFFLQLILFVIPYMYFNDIVQKICLFINIFISINIGIAIFNLIPIPPLDGSRLLNVILPPKAYFGIMKHETKIYWIFFGWIFLGPYVSRALLSIPLVAANPPLTAIAGFFDLSNILGVIISYVYTSMMSFWQLIPFLKI